MNKTKTNQLGVTEQHAGFGIKQVNLILFLLPALAATGYSSNTDANVTATGWQSQSGRDAEHPDVRRLGKVLQGFV